MSESRTYAGTVLGKLNHILLPKITRSKTQNELYLDLEKRGFLEDSLPGCSLGVAFTTHAFGPIDFQGHLESGLSYQH